MMDNLKNRLSFIERITKCFSVFSRGRPCPAPATVRSAPLCARPLPNQPDRLREHRMEQRGRERERRQEERCQIQDCIVHPVQQPNAAAAKARDLHPVHVCKEIF